MITRFLFWLLLHLEGGETMLALFMAQRIIKYPEQYKFSDMPETMKPQIATVLIDSGAEHLIDDPAYLPKETEGTV